MAPTAHSRFSASASARLLACLGSYAKAQQFDDGTRKSSIYSAEGTLAHAIAEACLFAGREAADFIGQTRTVDGFDITIDDEFAEAVQSYVDYLRALRAMGFVIALENKVSPQVHWTGLPPLNIALFGTSDCIAYHPGLKILIIVDLKFGKGIAVEVANNSQLLYYGAGSLDPDLIRAMLAQASLTGDPDVTEVRTTIVQPRAFHREGPVRSHSYRPDDVINWSRTTLYDGVKAALADGGKTLFAGKHCRFCPAFAHCDAPKTLAFQTAVDAFKGAPIQNIPAATDPNASLPGHLTDQELADLLDRIEIVSPWLDAVRRLAMERREAGRDVPGWTVAPTRALRRWAEDDTNKLVQDLRSLATANGFAATDVLELKPLSPAQIEKKIGKKEYERLIQPHVVKRSSGKTLVPDGDPRARVRRTAQEAFNLPAPTQASHPLLD